MRTRSIIEVRRGGKLIRKSAFLHEPCAAGRDPCLKAIHVRYWSYSGNDMLNVSFSAFDPTRTLAARTAAIEVANIAKPRRHWRSVGMSLKVS
jgi:hypothetical protein